MLAVKVTIDEGSLKQAEYILRAIPRALPRVMRRAVKRTVDTAATDVKRRVGKEIAVPLREIARGLHKKQPTNSNWSGSVGAGLHRPSLVAFKGTKQTRRGVTYRISPAAGRKLLEHGFIQAMPSGHRGVFLRKDRQRLPIGEKRGPSIWKVVTGAPGLLAEATKRAGDQLGKSIDDQIGVELRRWEKR
jgi:hypothetical protein